MSNLCSELDIGEAAHPPPYNGVAWRRIRHSGEITAEAREFGEIEQKRAGSRPSIATISDEPVENDDL
ncbi:MAG: hypothetical protein II336_04105 [Loktanella sp.]|nr:hypothetical protein [Loktanella sp.]